MGPQVARRNSPAAARRPGFQWPTTRRTLGSEGFLDSLFRRRRRCPLLLSEPLPSFDEIAHWGASRMQRLPHLILRFAQGHVSSLVAPAQEPLDLTVAGFRGTTTSQRLRLLRGLRRRPLVVPPTHPAMGRRRRDHAPGFSRPTQLIRQRRPSRIATLQAMTGLDQYAPQIVVAGPDQTGVRLSRSARGIPRGQPAEARQLLAGTKTVEASHCGAEHPGRHRSHPGRVHNFCTTASSFVSRARRCSTA